MERVRTTIPLLVSLLLIAPLALSAPAPLDDPVVNGDFEVSTTPAPVSDAIAGSPADECIGIGHQIFYGEDSWQQKLIDDQDPEAALEQIASDPEYEATFFAGYGYCVFSNSEGQDVAWVHLFTDSEKPTGWGSDTNPSVEFGRDHPGDDDPDNRAALFTAGQGSPHNIWQAYTSPHQAYSGNHQSFEVDVLDGAIPDQASVQISLSATPLETQSPWIVMWSDCQLIYDADQLQNGLVDGRVVVDPVEAQFHDRSATGDECTDAKERWDNGDADERREVLGQLRMIQLSFWRWNTGSEDVLVDNVAISGATLTVEEAPNTLF